MTATNPVLARELVQRVRGVRAVAILTVWLLVLTAIVYLVYETERGDDSFGITATRSALVGRGMFEWLVFFMLVLAMFVVPGLLSGAVAGERERQTLVPLQVTLLKPRSIVLGKIGAALAFVLLLLAAATPMLALSYLVGGITMGDVVRAVVVLAATTVMIACITVACSALFKKVQTATVVAYGVVLVLSLGSLLAYGIASAIDESRGIDAADPPRTILLGSPLAAVADVIGEGSQTGGSRASSPFRPIHDWIDDGPSRTDLLPFDPVGMSEEQIERLARQFGVQVPDFDDNGGIPFWVQSMALLGALSLVSLVVASRRLRTPARTER